MGGTIRISISCVGCLGLILKKIVVANGKTERDSEILCCCGLKSSPLSYRASKLDSLACSRAVCHTQPLAGRDNHPVELRQGFQRSQVRSNLAGMREHIVSQDEHVRAQLWQEQGQLRRSTRAVGIEEHTVERAGSACDYLSRIATHQLHHLAQP